MKNIWKVAPALTFNDDENYSSIILQLLANRGIDTKEKIESFFNPSYDLHVHDPFLFSDMEKVVAKLFELIENKKKICVYGDYDADGVCSSAIMYIFLKKIGADVFVYIPDRKKEGNGLNNSAVDYIKSQGCDFIITVDTGIVAFPEVDYANSLGMEVIITDHHEPIPGKKPNAIALINPKLEEGIYPFDDLAGVGVAFKVCSALALRHNNKDELLNFIKWNLDLVAIATIADMVTLVDENRTLAKYGMIVLNKTLNKGLKELKRSVFSGFDKKEVLDSSDIGFKIAPRINAAGRMDHANKAFELLISDDIEEINKLVLELNSKNSDRQTVVSSAVKNFIKSNEKIEGDKIIVAHDDSWPVGCVGLIATKIRDHYHLPTFALTTENNNIVGSGRSLEGFDITKSMQDNADLFVKFGGHYMACGCSISFDKYNEFNVRMKEYANKNIDIENLVNYMSIDAELNLKNIDLKLVDDVENLEPFGKGNEEPLFVSYGLEVVSATLFGKEMNHFKMFVSQDDATFMVVSWNSAYLDEEIKQGDKIDLVYRLTVNEWMGKREIRLMLVDFRKCS